METDVIILIVMFTWIFTSLAVALFIHGEDAKMWRRGSKVAKGIKYILFSLAGLVVFGIASYIFGFIWYYFCGGGLLFMDLGGGWFDKLLLGAGTLLCFGFLLSGIVIIFKK